jgi:hypothetical protein
MKKTKEEKFKIGTYKQIKTESDVINLRNSMAKGNYPLSMDDCFVIGINGDCNPKCPFYNKIEECEYDKNQD